ncbi:hypothetical protein [Pelosinus propionicus]|uniref:Uncharacterized protein n=1 Tax=Pelosinus propionicus DSM 13327 TaxID=1123291 RepID=A0A1I4IC84_9FIRM|nr:hypothetical protein [Pelosinus propionicus]SFL51992.1 hypothetical protein SAMN04490355_1007134 [Pelosinus propionicus DSM 13327]
MKKIAGFLSVFFIILIYYGAALSCLANDIQSISNQEVLLLIVDKSKETYGTQLQSEIFTQLKKQLKAEVMKESELINQSRHEIDEIAKVEQSGLLDLAKKIGADQVLVVEILPVKSDFSDIAFYKAIRSEVTLSIRLYDVARKQYVLFEDVAGTDTNKTVIPYTSVGKKVTVLEAIHKATYKAAEMVNQNAESD